MNKLNVDYRSGALTESTVDIPQCDYTMPRDDVEPNCKHAFDLVACSREESCAHYLNGHNSTWYPFIWWAPWKVSAEGRKDFSLLKQSLAMRNGTKSSIVCHTLTYSQGSLQPNEEDLDTNLIIKARNAILHYAEDT